MRIRSNLLVSASLLVCSLVSNVASASAQNYWYMYIQNYSNYKMTRLYVADQGSNWAACDIGSGIEAGKIVKVDTCPGRDCDQWVKTRYEDGGETAPVKVNLCNDPNTPIVITY
jgi:hypothetical protein